MSAPYLSDKLSFWKGEGTCLKDMRGIQVLKQSMLDVQELRSKKKEGEDQNRVGHVF